jgi:hypothetical protein
MSADTTTTPASAISDDTSMEHIFSIIGSLVLLASFLFSLPGEFSNRLISHA